MFSKKKSAQPERRVRAIQQSVKSNAVFSYHANRAIREGAQFRDGSQGEPETSPVRRKITTWRRRLPNVATILVVLVAAVFCMQLSNNATVKPVGDGKGQLFLRDQAQYANFAHDAFRQLVNTNKLTVNTDKISVDMKKQFPELQVVTVSLPVIGNKPTVYIQPAVPRLILVAKNGMYVLDGSGRALISGNQVAKLNDLGLPVVNDQGSFEVEIGAIALPRDTVAFIAEVVGQLKAKGLKPDSLILPVGTNELHLKMSGAEYTIKFNLHGDARAEAGTYLAVRKQVEEQHKIPHEYIDVRVENKAYYK